MEAKSSARKISRVALICFVVIGVVTVGGVIFTMQQMAAFGWETLDLQPLQVASGRIRGGDGPSTYRFKVRSNGAKVRFYFGPIVWGNPVNAADLKRVVDSSVVLESGGDYVLSKSVTEGACFWAIRNEGADNTTVEMKWD